MKKFGTSFYSAKFCRDCLFTLWKAQHDFVFFLNHIYVIKYKSGKPVYFHPTPAQRQVAEHLQWCIENGKKIRIVIMKGRRVGITELISAFTIWYTIFHAYNIKEPKYVDIYAGSEDQAKEPLKKMSLALELSPDLTQYIGTDRGKTLKLQKSIRFRPVPIYNQSGDLVEIKEMGSEINIKSSGGHTKRGRSPDMNIYDEASIIKDEDYFATSIAASSGDDFQIMDSTPLLEEGFFWNAYEKNSVLDDDDPDKKYMTFYFPSVELTEEGEKLLESGCHTEITAEHITKISAIGWDVETALERIQEYPFIRAMTEIFAKTVPSSMRYYPSEIVRPCRKSNIGIKAAFPGQRIDEITNKEIINWLVKTYTGIQSVKIGIDWAKRGHQTVVSVVVQDTELKHSLIYKEAWAKMFYPNQFMRIKDLFDKFTDASSRWPVLVYADATGTQDMGTDTLDAIGVRTTPVHFNWNNKQAMADQLYFLMRTGMFEFPDDERIYRGILSVDMMLKSKEDKHLDDHVASIWCAISDVSIKELASDDGGERRYNFLGLSLRRKNFDYDTYRRKMMKRKQFDMLEKLFIRR